MSVLKASAWLSAGVIMLGAAVALVWVIAVQVALAVWGVDIAGGVHAA